MQAPQATPGFHNADLAETLAIAMFGHVKGPSGPNPQDVDPAKMESASPFCCKPSPSLSSVRSALLQLSSQALAACSRRTYWGEQCRSIGPASPRLWYGINVFCLTCISRQHEKRNSQKDAPPLAMHKTARPGRSPISLTIPFSWDINHDHMEDFCMQSAAGSWSRAWLRQACNPNRWFDSCCIKHALLKGCCFMDRISKLLLRMLKKSLNMQHSDWEDACMPLGGPGHCSFARNCPWLLPLNTTQHPGRMAQQD